VNIRSRSTGPHSELAGLGMKEIIAGDRGQLSETCMYFSDKSGHALSKKRSALLRGGPPALRPYQNRIKTLSERAIGVVRRAKSRFPRLLERLRKREMEWKVWKETSRAQGRGVTRAQTAALGSLCYIVAGTSFGERNGQHERTAREWRNPRFSGCCAVCFAVHFGIQTGSIG
jgi:hypothetical protein